MTILYVSQPGAEVRKHKARLQVTWQRATLAELPLRDVERVVLLGPAQVSAAAARSLLAENVPVVYCSTHGRYYGTLAAGHEDTELLLAQVDRYRDEMYRLATARAIVQAKVGHSRSLLHRYHRNHPAPELEATVHQLDLIHSRAAEAASVPEVMGLEGHAAALYFPAYSRCLVDPDLHFAVRSRRPPRDPANALLSLGYMLLLGEVSGALAGQGLHLGLGFLHETSPRRSALPLDVLEAFRQPVADRLALSLFNRRVFTRAAFRTFPDGKVLLTEDGLKRYLALYERAMVTPFQPPGGGPAATFRGLIQEEARALKAAVRSGQIWSPLTLEL